LGKSRKTITTGNNYHLLVYHCLDVAACGYTMASENRFGMREALAELRLASDFGYRWISYLFASHDLGKKAEVDSSLKYRLTSVMNSFTLSIYGWQ